MKLALCCLVLLLLPALVWAQGPEGLDWKTAPAVPVMAVPPCAKAPVIDGVLKPGEWDDACAVSSFAQWAGAFIHPPTTAWFSYDGEKFYFATRSLKDKPEWYGARSRFRDSAVYLDSDIELFLSPDNTGGKTIIYQFCFNSYGAIYDVRVMPEIGLTETGYNPKMELISTETQSEWIIEGAIAVKDLDPNGFKAGQTWRANIARSWPQRAWSLREGPFIARDSMGRMLLQSDAPALQWLDLSSLLEGAVNLEVAVKNTTNRPQQYRLSVTLTGAQADDKLGAATTIVDLKPGERKTVRLQGRETFAGKRAHADLRCESMDGKSIYYQQYLRLDGKSAGAAALTTEAFRTPVPLPREISVSARYGALSNAVEAQVDVWSLRRAGLTPANVLLTVLPEKGDTAIATRTLNHFQHDLALCKFDLPLDIPYGPYRIVAVAQSAEGKEISRAEATFTRVNLTDPAVNRPYRSRPGHIFDWMHENAGKTSIVLPPWTPIHPERGSLAVWGRTITLDPSGLPKQITALGQPLLAGPAQLVARVAERSTVLAPAAEAAAPTPLANVQYSEASWQGQVSGEGLQASCKARAEYDGLLAYTVELSCANPVQLDELYLDLPLRAEVAQRMLLPNGVALLSAGTGTIWESKSVRDDELLGTLVPYLWVGNNEYGLSWGADNTRGWYEKSGASVVTLVRDDAGTVHLRVYFVRGPVLVENTTLEFTLLPTPTKPLPQGWRYHLLTPEWNYFWFMGWYHIGEAVINGEEQQSWDDPGPDHATLGVEQAREINRSTLALPYCNPQFTIPHAMPWVIQNNGAVLPYVGEDWANMPSRWGPIKPVASFRDWAAANYAYWMQLQGYGGFYIDESYGADGPDINLLNGTGGWFDRQGNLRGSYHTMDTREMLKRMYAITYLYGRLGRPYLLVHTSSFGTSPFWGSFATAVCSGEGDWEVHIPGESLLDRLPASSLEFYTGKAFGFYQTFFGDKMKGDAALIARSYEQIDSELMLYDMTRTQNYFGGDLARKLKLDFGIGEADVTFFGYWQGQPPVSSSQAAVKVSAYRRPTRSLLVAVNSDRAQQQVTLLRLNAQALYRTPGHYQIRDAVTGVLLPLEDGAIRLQLPARGERYLYVEEATEP